MESSAFMPLRPIIGALLILMLLMPAAGVATGQESCVFPTPSEVSPTGGAGALLVRPPTINELAGRSDVIIQARVRDWTSYSSGPEILTDIVFDVERVVAGVWQPRQA